MLTIAVALALQPVVALDYEPFGGLQLRIGPVPFVRGSAFEYRDPKSGAVLYSSRWSPKSVTKLPDGSIRVTYTGNGGNALGIHDFRLTAKGVSARYQFQWRGVGPVRVDSTYALLWAPAVSHGSTSFDGGAGDAFVRPVKGAWVDRRLATGVAEFQFESPLGTVDLALRGSRADFFDAREYAVEWAERSCLFWLGKTGLTVRPGETLDIEADWTIAPRIQGPRKAAPVSLTGVESPSAKEPDPAPGPLVPAPKDWRPSTAWLVLGDRGGGEWSERLQARLGQRFRLSGMTSCRVRTITDAALVGPEEYRVEIASDGVTVSANNRQATVRAIETLAKLARPVAGRLALPVGTLSDRPSVTWRGVHLFSGKGAGPFQERLVRDVLEPLAFNRAVVQCERTRWKALGKAAGTGWADPQEVRSLFDDLRGSGVEPVPLIQSLGHMDWLLDNDNRRLAVRPETPYVLDVRRQSARALLSSVWDEATAVLKPATVHFGLDETDMRGMPDDPTLATRLWEVQVPELVQWARKKGLGTMFWGDMLLVPGQAPDACHGKDGPQAARRISATKGLDTVADWHYFATDDPGRFTSLASFQEKGFRTVAASWWRPKNVRSHTLAAVKTGSGTLQTTWAGYTTDESAAIKEAKQFAAYVLAADYAWSGRTETPDRLGYDPLGVFCDWMWRPKRAVVREPGRVWSDPQYPDRTRLRIGETQFALTRPSVLWTPLSPDGAVGSGRIEWILDAKCREVCLAADCIAWENEAAPVARITVESVDGTQIIQDVLYGADVRAPEDVRPILRFRSTKNLASIELKVGEEPVHVRRIVIEPLSPTAGFRLYGVTTL